MNSIVHRWLEAAGLDQGPLHLPAGGKAPLGLVIDASGLRASDTCATVASYRRGTVQHLPIHIVGLQGDGAEEVRAWLGAEPLVRFVAGPEEIDDGADALLVLPAGILFGTHSIEAAYAAAAESKESQVLRAVVDGAPRSVELWQSSALQGDLARAEASARRAGKERWVSGASLGLYYLGRPQPRPHLRKGPAGTLELVVVVQDGAGRGGQDYLDRIKELEAEVARLRRAQWSSAVRNGQPVEAAKAMVGRPRRSAARLARIARWSKR